MKNAPQSENEILLHIVNKQRRHGPSKSIEVSITSKNKKYKNYIKKKKKTQYEN